MYNMSVQASQDGQTDPEGSFRFYPDEQRRKSKLALMGYEPEAPVVCRANTLVIADTQGLHRRGIAAPGVERPAFKGNVRRRNPYRKLGD